MDSLPPFHQHFAHLVWLLIHREAQADEQKDVLRRAMEELAQSRHVVGLQDISFTVANAFHHVAFSDNIIWLSELSVRMSAHSVRTVEFEQSVSPGDVLGLARLFAKPAVSGDDGAAFDAMVVRLGPTDVAVHIGPMGFVRTATPTHLRTVLPGPARTPAGAPAIPAVSRGFTPPAGIPGAGTGTPSKTRSERGGVRDDTLSMMHAQITPHAPPAKGLAELLARLDAEPGAARLIEDAAREAEERAKQGLWVDLAEVLWRLHQRHARSPEGDLRRACLASIRRLEKPVLMQGLARLLPRRREMREMLTQLLARSGESGADALIDLLINAEHTAERRAYRTALSHCPAAVPALLHLLGDSRWYVVRNAAELLGELAPPDADIRLAELLSHREPRVRRAAAGSLSRFGTQRAVLGLLQAVQDASPDVRLQVVLGLGAIRNPRAVPWLVEALDREQDPDVQSAIIASLGMMPTEESVARLARAVEPGGLLLRKSTIFRLHAVEALGQAASPSA
ncbi:MAG TPA: HEAT repeat domain-containing protein, partial [Gemmatimonadaceae bacterium]|nr:HEAT repeat domain-containing protein [Gemmatimonadaceae bacterium]